MLELGAFPEAVTLCRRAIALDPTQPNAHFNLSHALKAMNLWTKQRMSARQAIALCARSGRISFPSRTYFAASGGFGDRLGGV